MEAEGDCNVGYDLDACEGESCLTDSLTPAEGMDGVDNALAGLQVAAVGGGRNLADLNQSFSDALCGRTESSLGSGDCSLEIPPVEIRFEIEPNPTEACARVRVLGDDKASDHILNLSENGCLSGELGAIPVPLVSETGSLENTVVRMTVSPNGFSHGLLGGIADASTSWEIFFAYFGGAADPTASWFDARVSPPSAEGALAACDGMSATLRIGGVALEPTASNR
jgi:hypothetical protein